MPEWMRSQFMAPAYALLISLAVALVLGRAMRPADVQTTTQQDEQPPATNSVTIQLVTEEPDSGKSPTKVPAAALKGSSVTIQSGKPLKVGENGAVTWPAADGSVTVCVQLPGKWQAVKQPNAGGTLKSPCWTVDLTTNPVELVVKEG